MFFTKPYHSQIFCCGSKMTTATVLWCAKAHAKIVMAATCLMVVLLLVVFCPSVVQCEDETADPESNYQEGFPKQISGDIYGQVQSADLDGDRRKELIFGATDGCIHVFNYNGTARRMMGVWPRHTGGPIMSPLAVSDLDNNGDPEILAGSFDGKVYALSKQGKLMWKYDTGGSITLAAPVAQDINGDGKQEIAVASHSKKLSLLDNKGFLKWEHRATSTLSGTPVLGDVDGDGRKDVVVRSDAGWLEVLGPTGAKVKGWPVPAGGPSGFYPFLPRVDDLNSDGEKEIIVGAPSTNSLAIMSKNGKISKNFEIKGYVHDQVRVADVNGDGFPDLVYGRSDGKLDVVDVRKTMARSDGKKVSFPGWPKKVGDHIYGMPQVADIDGDGKSDIIFTSWNSRGEGLETGTLGVVDLEGRSAEGFPKSVGKTFGRVTLADLDGDGDIEIICPGGIGYTGPQLHVFDCPGRVPLRMAILARDYD